MRSRNARPAVDLALVEAVGPAEVLQPLGLPVDLREQGDALDQLVRQALARARGRCRTARATPSIVHRRPAVDEAHQVEGAARAPTGPSQTAMRRGVGHVGAVERLDDAPLAQDAVVARRRGPSAAGCAARRAGRRGGSRRSRSACRRETKRDCSSGLALARASPDLVAARPVEALDVDHRLPTSCSRYSAYFGRAAARRLGRCWVGHRSSLGW